MRANQSTTPTADQPASSPARTGDLSTSKTDMRAICKIVTRAMSKYPELGNTLSLTMDIEYAHQETPLDLDALLNADEYNFAHDVFGIVNNFNRQTLTMGNCFLPRFTQHETAR